MFKKLCKTEKKIISQKTCFSTLKKIGSTEFFKIVLNI